MIIVSPVIDKTKGIGGTFTEGQQYPVLEIRDSPGFGLMLVIPDDTGEIRQYKAENFHYVWTERQQPNSVESRQPEKEKPGEPASNSD